MTSDQAITAFISYSSDEKAEFIAQLIYELTLLARESYETGGDGLDDPKRVRHINELQHHTSAYLSALLRSDAGRYPDDVLVRIVLDHADDPGLSRQLLKTFARLAAQRLTPA
ncbi:MAG TPA: hypothetical protein VK388_17830 [Pyrinomonadaceae bacterium]|nr:hypothetical protein [Pyrinomonadaceae bacterium]